MKSNLLKGSTLLITRPKHQAASLCALLEENGAKTLLFPTLLIEPLQNISVSEKIKRSSIIVVLSANAVPALSSVINQFYNSIVIAIGSGTQKALEKNNIHVDLVPDNYNTEGLLSLPILNHAQGKSIAIFCGEQSKPLLKETLRKRGAEVNEVISYRRVCPNPSEAERCTVKEKSPNLIISTSEESLRNLITIFSSPSDQWIYTKHLVVISEKMASLALTLGFKHRPTIAHNPTDQGILEAILRAGKNTNDRLKSN